MAKKATKTAAPKDAVAAPKAKDRKPKFEAKVLPFYNEIDGLEDLKAEVDTLRDLGRRAAEIAAEIAGQKLIIQALMEANDLAATSYSVRVDPDGTGISYIKPTKGSRKYVTELLLLAGVTEKQLEKGSKPVPPKKPYVQLIQPSKNAPAAAAPVADDEEE